MAENRGSGEAILAFLLGAAAGAALGVILAPDTGKNTRRRLSDWAESQRGKGEKLMGEAREVIVHKKDQVSAAVEAGKKAYQETGNRA